MPQGDAKTKLYEAALELMGRNGIEATSTREILGAVGIKNPSAISYHFGSKAGLVDAIAAELAGGQYPILGRQTELAAAEKLPTALEWVQPVINTSRVSPGAAVVGVRRLPQAAVARGVRQRPK